MEETKTNKKGFSITALVLGIVSLVTWCIWIISIPCAILALIFGILGIRRSGKGMALAGIITSAITLVIWFVVFCGAFMYGFFSALDDYNYDDYNYSYHYQTPSKYRSTRK